MRWNANGNGELGRAPKFLISGKTPSLAFWSMTAGKFGSLKPRNVSGSRVIPECFESRPNRSLEEADLSGPKSVKSVTLLIAVHGDRERIGVSGSGVRVSVCYRRQHGNSDRFPRRIYISNNICGVCGVWETQELRNQSRDVGKPLRDAEGVSMGSLNIQLRFWSRSQKHVAYSSDALSFGKRRGEFAAPCCNRPLQSIETRSHQGQERRAGSNPARL